MNTNPPASNACPHCGTALPSTGGLCPRCLMAEAMSPTQTGAEFAGARAALPPEELAPYFPQLEILECLGRGGMGVVYRARQKALNRLVALKLLAPERVAHAGFEERFKREAQALAALSHPHIVTVYDFGQAGGFYYLLMEYVDGVNLRQAMRAGRFTPEQALAIVPPVCEALQYAHEHGIVHRDIKPENLLLDREGRVKIADFGLAKLVGQTDSVPEGASSSPIGNLQSAISNVSAGTPPYMAPEQQAHRRTDHRADIYSLGVVLYELLTGELPGKPLEPPSKKVVIDVRLDEVVLRALEQQPERRYQQVSQVKTMVETIVGEGRKQESEVRSQKSEGARGQVSGVRSASPTEHGGRPPRKWYTLVGDYRGTRIIHWDRILLAGYVFFAVLFVFLLIPFALAKNMPPSEPVLGMTLLASVAIVAIGMTGFVRRQLRVPVERLPQFDALPWYVTWQKLMQPPLVRDIHEHMTAAEKRALLMFNLPGMLFFFALCVPMGLYANAPNAGRLMTASFCLVAAYALINLWRGLRWKFYCSTAWARQQGITPEKIKADVGASWGEDVTPSGKARRRRRWYGAAVAAVMAFMAAALISTVRHANHPPDAADRPDVLRKLPTAEVILAGVAKPEVPWAWQELGRRQLSTNEVARIFDGLTAWIRGTSPDEHRPPLNWADEFLRELDRRGLVTDGETVGLMEAIHGSPRCPPALRIREGQTNVALQCEWANPWERERVGLTIQNELRSVTVDGQPATAWRNDWNSWKHWQFSGKVTFPILAPGKHAVKMEVLTALAASDDLVGLADQAPSTEWPRARKRWVRTATTELIVYPRDAEMVSLTRDPALDPRQPGKMALSIKRIIIRPKGERLEAVVVPNIDREMLPVSVSFDAELRVAGRALPCEGQLWAIKAGPNAAVNDAPLTAELDRLDPAVRDAHVLLTPNPKPLERFPAVDRIWGEQMGFSQVPLMRQDLPGGPTNEVVRHDALNATVDMAFQPRGPWIAGTGDGATVELLGVATAAGANAPCWRPNGEAFDQPLPEQGVYRDNSGNFDTPRSNEVRRVFITRVKNTTPNSYGLDYDVQPHSGMQGPSTLTSRAATNGVMVLTFEAMIPDTNRTATVRVGIGSGPWQTGALVQQNESGEVTGLTSGSCGSLSRAVETKDGVVVFSLDRMLTEQIRVLAVLRDHREVEAQLQPDGGFGEERPLTATFPGLTLKQILEIRLEHRPYDWVTFRNVALHSGLTEQDKAPFVEPPIDLRPWLFIVSIIGGVVLLLGIAAWKSRLGKVASLALIVMAVGLVPLAFVVYRMASDRGRVSDAEIAKRATAFVEDLRNGRVAEAHARLDWTLGFRWTDPELRRWWQSQALSYGPLQSIRILQVDHGPLNMRRVTLRCDGEKRDYGLRLSFFPTGEIEGIKTLRLDVPDLAPTKAAPAGPEAMGTPARPPEVPVSPVGQTRLSWMGWALFLSAPLSWFVVRRILRSRSPRRGPALALCIPLLALQAFAIIVICRFVAKVIVDFHANPSALNNPNVHPAFMTRLGNTLFQHPDFPSIAGGAIAVVLGILIVRAVSHATNKPAAGDAPQASPPAIPLAASASRFGKLALMLSVGAVCLLAVGLSLRAIRPTLPGAAVLELTAFVFGILGWKSRAGKAAVILLLLQPPFAALLWPLVQMPAAHAGSRATPTVHYEVFEIETAQADALVPADQRQSGFSENWQVARVTPGTIQALLNALVSEPVLMVDRKLEISNLGTRSPTYVSTQKGSVEQQQKVIGWALKADNWGYSRQDNRPDGAGSYEVNGSGWFGLRRADGQFLARVEQTVNIRIEARPPVVVNLEYEGPAPTSDAWAFFIPFTRSDNSTRYVVLTVEADESGGRATAVQRSLFPQAAHIGNAAGTVLVHHDGVDVHYVLFATNAVGSSTSDSYNTRSLAWTDHGSFKLTERLTFGYHRESTDPLHLQINGQEYDLRQGRVIVLREDGTAQQLKLFPPLAVAREPAALAKLLASSQREPEPLALTFGPATNGLQAAVELTTSNGVFRLGEPIEVVFHIRNSSSERRFLTGASWRQGDELMVEDQRGQKIEVHNITQLGATPIKSEYLLPGWTAVFHSASLAFLPEEASEKQVPGSVGYYVKVKPGKYTIRFRLHFAADKKNDADWQGDLETAPVTVDVKAAAVSAPPLVTTMPTPAAATSELAAPPQLRFLAWQDEAKEWPNGRTWHADGTPVTDSRELWLEVSVSPTRNRIENNPELVKEDPRFLHLWFSHPSLDNRSYARVALLDAAGNPLPLAAAGQVGSSSSSPSANSDQLGWITYTLSPGAVGHTPTTATVRLAYSVGPWGMDTPIEPDYRGVMGLPGNATLAGIGENVAGKAFISIAEETVAGVPAMQLSFTARTTDGRELASPSHIVGGPSAGPRMEQFEFDAPLSTIKEFHLRARPIRTAEYRDVTLRLSASPNSGPESAEPARGAAASAVSSNLTRRGTFTGTKGETRATLRFEDSGEVHLYLQHPTGTMSALLASQPIPTFDGKVFDLRLDFWTPATGRSGFEIVGQFRIEQPGRLTLSVWASAMEKGFYPFSQMSLVQTESPSFADPDASPRPPTPHLQFRLVAEDDDSAPADEFADPNDQTGAKKLRVRRDVLFDETAVVRTQVTNTDAGTELRVKFTKPGWKSFAEVLARTSRERLAVLVDGEVRLVPEMRATFIHGNEEIGWTIDSSAVAEVITRALTSAEQTTADAPAVEAPSVHRIGLEAPHLQFRLVAEDSDTTPADELADPSDPTGAKKLRVLREVLLDETAVAGASVTNQTNGTTVILLTFTPGDARTFAAITRDNIMKRLAIVFDGKLLSAPCIREQINGGRAQISGTLSDAEAAAIVAALNAGKPAAEHSGRQE